MITRKIKTEAEQITFFEKCLSKFSDAVEACTSIRHYYTIADTRVCIVFAGKAMVPFIAPALDHLKTDPVSNPDLTLCVWDSKSTSVTMVPPPCSRTCFTDRGDIWGFTSKQIKTAFHWVENSVNVMDLDQNVGIFWVHSPEQLPFWVFASPLRTLFHWWLEKNHCQMIHAAAVGTKQGAVLVTGKGGVGKSTTALSCLENGMLYLGDDYVIVKKSKPNPFVYSIYSTAKLNPEDSTVFSSLSTYIQNTDHLQEEKAVMCLYPGLDDLLIKKLPVKAILTPVVNDREETDISSIHPWTIQRAMSFTTMSQLPYVGRHTHEYINGLVNSLPVYQLNLGRNLKGIPSSVKNLLNGSEFQRNGGDVPWNDLDDYPLVSVIIPVYNGKNFIKDAIANVISQEYPALELIVVNDGSTDDTRQILNQMNTDIRILDQDNSGPASARNRGIQNASGDYILFLDVDDLWPENTIHLLVRELQKNRKTGVVRGYAQVLLKDEQTGKYEYFGNPKDAFPDYIGAGIYRKTVFNRVGLFDPELKFGEDTDWYSRAVELKVPIKRIEDVTLHVRRHGDNMTEGKDLLELNTLRVFKKALDRNRSSSKTQKNETMRVKSGTKDRISVIIPAYNRESYIEKALESVLRQTLSPYEIILVDDGSTDNTAGIVRKYKNRVKVLYQENAGPAAARNKGILASKGNFLAFLDSDDIWLENKLDIQMNFIKTHPASQGVVCHINYFKEPGTILPGTFNANLLNGNPVGMIIQAMLVKRSVFDTVGLFNPALKTAEDVDWFCRADDLDIRIDTVQEVLLKVRIHGDNMSFKALDNTKNLLKVLSQSVKRKKINCVTR